jgi:WD40 repeat protein
VTSWPVIPVAHPSGGFSVTGMTLSEDNYAVHWLLYLPPGEHQPWEARDPRGSRIEHQDSDPTGRFVAISTPRRLEIRDARTGRIIWSEERSVGDDFVELPTFVPDGNQLITVKRLEWESGRTRIRLRETESGTVLHEQIIESNVQDVGISADGLRAVAALGSAETGELLVFEVASGNEIARLPLLGAPREVTFLSDPEFLAVWDFASNINVWNIGARQIVHPVWLSVTASERIHARDAMRAATLQGRSIRLWDSESFEEVAAITAEGVPQRLTISPDGRTVAFFSEREQVGSSVVVWTPEAAENSLRHVPAEKVAEIVFSHDGAQLAFRSQELPPGTNAWVGRTVRVIAIKEVSETLTLRALPHGQLTWIGFSADGSHLLTVETARFEGRGIDIRPSMLRVFDLDTGSEVARRALGTSEVSVVPGTSAVIYHDSNRRARRLDLDGETLDAVRSVMGGTVHTVPGSTRSLLEAYWGPTQAFNAETEDPAVILNARDGPYNVLSADLSADGTTALLSLRERDWSTDSAGRAELRDTSTGALAYPPLDWSHFFNGAWLASNGVAFLSRLEGNYVREGEAEFGLVWWNSPTGEARTLISDNPVTYAAVSPDGTLFAAALGATTEPSQGMRPVGTPEIGVWEAATGALKFSLPTDQTFVRLAISDNNRYLAASSTVGQDVYDLKSQEVVLTVGRGASHSVGTTLDYATDSHARALRNWRPRFIQGGNTLVLVTNQSIILHNLADGITDQLNESASITSAALSADGRYAALIAGGEARIWDLDARERVVSISFAGLRQLAFAGGSASTLLAMGAGGVVRLVWKPDELAERACRAFGAEDWARSRYRLTGAEDAGLCAEASARHLSVNVAEHTIP